MYEDNPYQSGGKEKHAELGLDWYFYSLRTCNPETGRWLQQDPYDEFFSPYCAMGNNPANFTDPTGGFTGQTSHQQYGAGGTGQTGSGQSFNNSSNSTKGKPRCPKPGKTYENGKAGGKHKNNSNPNGGPSSQNGGGNGSGGNSSGGNGFGNSGTQPMDGQANAPSSGGGSGGGDNSGDSFSLIIYDSRNYTTNPTDNPYYDNTESGNQWHLLDLADMSNWDDVINEINEISEDYSGGLMNVIIRGHGNSNPGQQGSSFFNGKGFTSPAKNDGFYAFLGKLSSSMSNSNGLNGKGLVGHILLTCCGGSNICRGGVCLGPKAQSSIRGQQVHTINGGWNSNASKTGGRRYGFFHSAMQGRKKGIKGDTVNAPFLLKGRGGGRNFYPNLNGTFSIYPHNPNGSTSDYK